MLFISTVWSLTGRLPSPERIHVNELFNSSTIQWEPPYSSLNIDTIRVNPHITQYTVYIADNQTIVIVNVTETQFTFSASENGLCPMYQISAWNAGGEGELSEPVQEHSKLPIPHMRKSDYASPACFYSSSEDSNWKSCCIHSFSSFAYPFTCKLD